MKKQKTIEEIKADYNLFIEIQMGKYLKNAGKSEFDNDKEAKSVIDKIVNAYNQKIASQHNKLDNLDLSGKTAWFNFVEINFKEETPGSKNEFHKVFNEESNDVIGMMDERFPFLPKGSFEVLVYAGPALDASGLPLERYKTLLLGEDKPTGIEEDLFTWVFDITVNVMGSLFETTRAKREKCYKEAIEIAEEKLNRKDSEKAVDEIAELLVEANKTGEEKKKKKRKK